MGKALCEAGIFGSRHHGDFLAHVIQNGLEVIGVIRGVIIVNAQIKESKLKLTQAEHAALEILGRQHLVKKFLGQHLARINVRGKRL